MASGINVTSIYGSFSEFKKMFGVEFPDDRRIAFKSGEGRFISFSSISIEFSENLIEREAEFIVDVKAGGKKGEWVKKGWMKSVSGIAMLFIKPFCKLVDFPVTFLIGMLQARRTVVVAMVERSRNGNYH